jgi:hypothetical protein
MPAEVAIVRLALLLTGDSPARLPKISTYSLMVVYSGVGFSMKILMFKIAEFSTASRPSHYMVIRNDSGASMDK